MLYGVTSHGARKSSYAATTVNVAISRAVDLFLLIVDRSCYGYNAEEVYFSSDDAKSYGFLGRAAKYMSVSYRASQALVLLSCILHPSPRQQ